MRRCDDGHRALTLRKARHINRFRSVPRPVIDSRENMAVNINKPANVPLNMIPVTQPLSRHYRSRPNAVIPLQTPSFPPPPVIPAQAGI